MNPPANEVLKNDLTAGLTATEAAKRRQNLIDVIMKGPEGFDTPAHRTARVERAKLAASIMKNAEVSEAGTLVMDKALAAIEDQVKKDQQKLATSVIAAEREGADRSLAALAIEKQKIIAARREVVAAKPVVAPAPAPAAAPAAAAKPPAKKEETMLESVVSTLSGVTDAVLPKKLTLKMTKEAKAIAAVATGAALVAGLVWLFNRGKDKAKSAGKGLLVAGAAVVAGILGWKFLAKFKGLNSLLGKGKDALKHGKDAAKYNAGLALYKVGQVDKAREIWGDKSDEIIAALEAEKLKEQAEKQFGLTDQEYEDAKLAYKNGREVTGPEDIRKIFKLPSGGTSVAFEAFMNEMREFYKVHTDDFGHTYVRASEAIENYEIGFSLAVNKIERWIKDHKVATTAGTLLAARLGILSAICSGGGTMAQKSFQLANSMRRFGMRHPLLSVLFIGGSVVTLNKAISGRRGVLLPENLEKLTRVAANKLPLILDLDTAQDALATVGDEAKTILEDIIDVSEDIGVIAGDFGMWLSDAIADFLSKLDDGLSDVLRLTDEKTISEKTIGCIDRLKEDLEDGLKTVLVDSSKAGIHKKYQDALKLLDNYRVSFLKHRCAEFTDSQEPVVALNLLIEALKDPDIGISISIEDGVVKWIDNRNTSMGESLDLSVDPSIQNKDTIHSLSTDLYHGQSDFDYTVAAGFTELREQWERNGNKVEGLGVDSKCIATVLGNYLYFMEFDASTGFVDWGNVYKWSKVSLTVVPDLLGTVFTEDNKDYKASLATSFVTTGLFSLNAAMLAQVKRFAIGGGPLLSKKMRLATSITPGVAHARFVHDVKGGIQDIRTFNSLRKTQGIRVARSTAIRFAKAGIKPEFLLGIKNATTMDQLMDIASDCGIILAKGNHNTVALAKTYLRSEIALKLKAVGQLDLRPLKTLRFWKVRTLPSTTGDMESLYDKVRDALDDPAKASADAADDALKVAKTTVSFPNGTTNVKDCVRHVSSIDDAATRVVHYKELLKRNMDVSRMMQVGANADELLAAGADAQKVIDGCLGITDIPTRLDAMRVLIDAGHVDDLQAAARLAGPSYVKNMELLTDEAADATADATKVADATEEVTDAADDVLDATKAETAAELFSPNEWKSAIKAAGGAVTVATIDDFLKAAAESGAIKLDTNTLALISQSNGAKKILAAAAAADAATDGVTEINRALRAAGLARNFRIGMNAAGAAGDVFAVYMAYADYVANGERIETAKQTNNAALAEMYSNANYMYAAEAAGGVAGISIGGTAIVTAYAGGQSVTTALGAAGGLIMLPIAVATLSGRYIYNKAEGVSEEWLRNEKDWMHALTPGELQEKLKSMPPGTHGYWQGWGKGTILEQAIRNDIAARTGDRKSLDDWDEKGFATVEGANDMTRYYITKAYIIRTTLLGKLPDESDTEYKERFDRNVSDQMTYLANSTQGKFAYSVVDFEYPMARLHAELMEKSRQLKKDGTSENISWSVENNDGTSEDVSMDLAEYSELIRVGRGQGEIGKQTVLTKYFQQQREQKVAQFNVMQQLKNVGLSAKQKEQIVSQHLSLEVQDALLKLDGRISSTDFVGIGGETLTKGLARYTASVLYKKELAEQVSSLLTKAASKGITTEDYDNSIQRLKSVLSTDPLELQKIGNEAGYVTNGKVSADSKTADLLSSQHVLHEMEAENEEAKFVEEFKEELQSESDATVKEYRRSAGDLYLMQQEGVTGKYRQAFDKSPSYFQVQYGNPLNKYLYAKFTGGEWKVNIGGGSDGPWSSASSYRATSSFWGFSETVAGKYNAIIEGLSNVNGTYAK